MCGQSLGSRSPLRWPHMSPLWHQASKWNLKFCTAIYQRVFKCHFPICIGPFLHINVILLLMYIFLRLHQYFALGTLMRLQGEPAFWGKMTQLLPLVALKGATEKSEFTQPARSQSPSSLVCSSALAQHLTTMSSCSGQGHVWFFACLFLSFKTVNLH